MPITKSETTVWTAQATSATSASQSLGGNYASQLAVRIAMVGTATSAATWTPSYSYDGGSTYFVGATFAAALTGTTDFPPVEVPVTATNLTIAYVQQSGGTSSAITAHLGQVTAV